MDALAIFSPNARWRDQSSVSGVLLLGLFFLSPLVTAAIPRLAPVLFFVVGLALIAAALRRASNWRQLLQPNTALAACLLVALYTLLNAAWALDHGAAAGKAGLLLTVTLVTFAAAAATASLDQGQLRKLALAFVAGACLGAIFVLLELLTDGAVTRSMMDIVPLLRPTTTKHVSIAHGRVESFDISKFKLNTTLLMLNLWPALLVVSAFENVKHRVVFVPLFFLAVTVPIVVSNHSSSQVALATSLPVLALALKWPRFVIAGLASLWCGCFLLVIPLDFAAYKADLHQASWLPSSYRARIIIWDYTAEQVFAHPVFGVGARSTRILRQEQATTVVKPEGFVFSRSLGQHAHDLFLQTWFELGAMGVILIALAGAAVIMRIQVLPIRAQPFAAATFTAFAGIATFAWDMWQSWWMAAVGLAALYLCVGAASVRERPPEGP
jgi:O-antigen ligase